MQRVASTLMSVLKYGNPSITALSRDSWSFLLECTSSSSPTTLAARTSKSNCASAGFGCLRRMEKDGKLLRILFATEMFARSMNSSTMPFASLSWYISASCGFWLSESRTNFICGEASVSAPASIRRCRRTLATAFSRLSPMATSSFASGSSKSFCASPYARAARERMTVFANLVSTISNSGVISQKTEKASRSTLDRNEQRSVESIEGIMSILFCTR
mmetsp:Transcript_8470/g.20809  ORF Transcript_8470/g.20809 Transcript_8470/m.20809 type:complete len:218 (+) Transcript_8470:419-1072(+)